MAIITGDLSGSSPRSRACHDVQYILFELQCQISVSENAGHLDQRAGCGCGRYRFLIVRFL